MKQHRCMVAAGVVALILAGTAAAQTPSFSVVTPAPGLRTAQVLGVSADGSRAAGYSAAPGVPGFTWTRQGGRYDFGLQPGVPNTSAAYAISGDGTTVVGYGGAVEGFRAYRYRGPGTFETLGVQAGYVYSYATGVSGDGSVVVGRSETDGPGARAQAFRWTVSSGLVGLGFTTVTDRSSQATAVSRDGITTAGWVGHSDGQTDAVLWRPGSPIQVLDPLPGTVGRRALAWGINMDGSVVVGVSGQVSHCTLWRNGRPTDLGTIPTFATAGLCVNDAGTVVGGTASGGIGNLDPLASVWTEERGIEPLSVFLAANGVLVPENFRLTACYATDAAGVTFAGTGLYTDTRQSFGFVAAIPAPGGAAAVFAAGILSARRRRRWGTAGGDVNLDGVVDATDLALFIDAYNNEH